MTEAEWEQCDDPRNMLEKVRYDSSRRKMDLFGCACCRRVWLELTDPRSTSAVEFLERLAEGQVREADSEQIANAAALAAALAARESGDSATIFATQAVLDLFPQYRSSTPGSLHVPQSVAWAKAAIARQARRGYDKADRDEYRDLARLLRCIVGNPFRSVTLCNRPTAIAVHLAAEAYEHRDLPRGHLDNDRLTVLADALEEAGCDDADILSHLRSSGPHVRGCWALDLVLGKK